MRTCNLDGWKQIGESSEQWSLIRHQLSSELASNIDEWYSACRHRLQRC